MKKVTVVNVNVAVDAHISKNGNTNQIIPGGSVQQYVNLFDFMNPVISSSVHGAGWLMVAKEYDNNWA